MTMRPALRLSLGLGTLATLWLAVFVASWANVDAGADAEVRADGAIAEGAAPSDAAAAIDAVLTLSRDTFAAGQWQESLAPTRALVARFPGQHVYLARLAEIHHKLGQPADEAAAWELFMERAPLPADACPHIGYAYRRLGKNDEALHAFERCFESDTTNAELAFFVGLANEWLSRLQPAEDFYRTAIGLATVHHDSEVGLARVLLHQNRLAEARTRAAAVLARVPTHVDALLVAGLAAQREGRRREAREYLEHAVELSQDYFDVQLALGILDYSESRYVAARQRFEAAATLDARRRGEVQPWLARTAAVKVGS
jgi:tetratricopeptide (TPR) repeat protein